MGDARSVYPGYPQLAAVQGIMPASVAYGWGFAPGTPPAGPFKQPAAAGMLTPLAGPHLQQATHRPQWPPAAAVHPQQQWQQRKQQQQQPAVLANQQPWWGAVSVNRVVVVSTRFCLPQRTTLVLQEGGRPNNRGSFTVLDAYSRPHFCLAVSPFSFSCKRHLLDACSHTPLLTAERKLFSLHGSWVLTRPQDGARLAKVQPEPLTSPSPCVKVFLGTSNAAPDFIIKGDFLSKRFTIYQCLPGAGEVVIAAVNRESCLASANAFLMSMLAHMQKYFLEIEPGVDAAFVTALAMLCDEMYSNRSDGE